MGNDVKEGIQLPGEADDKCCWCLPINVGVIVIGVLIIIQGLQSILNGGAIYTNSSLWGILVYCALIPQVLAAILFIMFFIKMQDANARKHTVLACLLMVLSCIFLGVIFILYPLLNKYTTISHYLWQIIVDFFTACCWFYFAGVCKRYSGM